MHSIRMSKLEAALRTVLGFNQAFTRRAVGGMAGSSSMIRIGCVIPPQVTSFCVQG
jgi:hypothetical protein